MKTPRKISETFPNMKVILNEKEVEKLGVIISLQNPNGIQSLLKNLRTAYKNNFEKNNDGCNFCRSGRI